MRDRVLVVLAFLALVFAPASSRAQTHLFIGGGPTGTSEFGFRGGWGGSLGIEHLIAEPASFLVRIDGAAVPSTPDQGFVYTMPLSLGESGSRSSDATLLSLMVGLRLGGPGRFVPYLDVLAGVGYLNDPANKGDAFYGPPHTNHTNLALSFGPGVAVRARHLPALFADLHYDFYFSQGATTPIMPVRMGVLVP